MKRLLQLTILVFIASLASAASASAQGAVVPLKKDVRLTVPAEGAVTKTPRCPGGTVAVSGTAVPAAGVGIVASVPRGVGSWRFRLVNARSRAVRVNAELRCMSIAVPEGMGDAFLRVGTGRVTRAHVPANGSSVKRVRCPRGTIPTGFGFDQGSLRSAGAEVQATAIIPTGYGYYVGLENLGDTDATVDAYARCVQRRNKADDSEHVLKTRVAKFSGRLRRGVYRLRAACPRGYWSVDAGFRFDPVASLFTLNARPTGTRGGRWYFASPTRRADAVRAYLLCVDLRTTFR